eukprot:CAMPEP_0119122180 /NCGR_PEP_ID=MMETSP1310-20130426/2506_1 /TAXON_ID=464262 /ORGANISM="Genus nov. species nov., Strain RCC2339" /LENGTH=360 /DNA_ID=CAMNT_0007111799 /DNA_START=49 /DNA_END=1128 /DNA_ORIENTATION=+
MGLEQVRKTVGFVTYMLILLVLSLYGALLYLLPFTLLLCIDPKLYRGFFGFIQRYFFAINYYAGTYLMGLKFTFTGDLIPLSESGLFMCNHRTRYDWVYLWKYYHALHRTSQMRIALKNDMRFIPAFGWCLQLFAFLSMTRKWEVDRENIANYFDSWRRSGFAGQLIFFAEGTDLSPGNKKRGHAYADKMGLPRYEYLLHPRTAGFKHCVQMGRGHLGAVYDATIAYGGDIPKRDLDWLFGHYPTDIYIHVERHALEDLPETDEGLAQWCQERFAAKEKKLADFYERKVPLGEPVKEHYPFGRDLYLTSIPFFLLLTLSIPLPYWLLISISPMAPLVAAVFGAFVWTYISYYDLLFHKEI